MRQFLLQEEELPEVGRGQPAEGLLALPHLEVRQGLPRFQGFQQIPGHQGVQEVVEEIPQHGVAGRLPRVDFPFRLRRKGLHAHVQAAGSNGHQHLFRGVGNEQEQRLPGRFLHHLQERVGRLGVHLFRQEQHHRPPAALHGAQGQPLQDGTGLVHGNIALFALDPDGFIELVLIKIGILQQQGAERRDELQGHRLAVPRHREHEMDVRMDQFGHTRRAPVQGLQEMQDDGESAAAVVLVEEKGVRDASGSHHLVQRVHHLRISVNGHHTLRAPT